MTRRQQREQAFILIFESLFDDDSIDEMIQKYEKSQGKKLKAFAKNIYEGTQRNKEQINKKIRENLKDWDENRISKASLAILQLAVYEILHNDDIPRSVSISEAVELAKKYGKDDDFSFVNGLLSNIN